MVVGEYTAKFIDYLVSRGLYLPSLHLMGLSLGAQMAGVCGQSVKSGRIQRITGKEKTSKGQYSLDKNCMF